MSEDTTFTWVYGKPKLVMKTSVYSQKMKISLTSLVAIVLEERIVGHVPKNMSKISHQYMTIPRKRVDREAGYGLEIPVQ